LWIKIINDGLSNDYESKSRWIGAVFIIASLIINVYTLFSPLAINTIAGVALTFLGLFSLYQTAKINPHTPASWSKALILLVAGVIFLLLGLSSMTSIGLVLGLLFLLGAINNAVFSYLTRRDATAFAWGAHALLSLFFAFTVLSNLETLTDNQVGLYLAITLLADGLTLLYSGRTVFIRP